jgi:hypothetical protein
MKTEHAVTLRLVRGTDSHYATITAGKRVTLAVLVEGNFGTGVPEWVLYLPGPDQYRYPGFPYQKFTTAEEAAETFFKFLELP